MIRARGRESLQSAGRWEWVIGGQCDAEVKSRGFFLWRQGGEWLAHVGEGVVSLRVRKGTTGKDMGFDLMVHSDDRFEWMGRRIIALTIQLRSRRAIRLQFEKSIEIFSNSVEREEDTSISLRFRVAGFGGGEHGGDARLNTLESAEHNVIFAR